MFTDKYFLFSGGFGRIPKDSLQPPYFPALPPAPAIFTATCLSWEYNVYGTFCQLWQGGYLGFSPVEDFQGSWGQLKKLWEAGFCQAQVAATMQTT
jgi:hypothetical protein